MDNKKIRERVLIVDDDLTLLTRLKNLLIGLGYEPIQASGSYEAMAILLKIDVALVISDMNMPDGDGLELLSFIKRLRPQTPFVLMTALSTLLQAQEAGIKGANYFLPKPFNEEDLKNALNFCLFDCDKGSKGHEELVRMYIGSFSEGDPIVSDVYLRVDKSKFIKVAQKGDFMTAQEVSHYRNKGIHYLYILKSDLKKILDLPESFQCQNSDSIKRRKQAVFKEMTSLLSEVLQMSSLNPQAFLQAEILMESTLSILVDHDEVFSLLERSSLRNVAILRKGLFIGFYSVLISQYLEQPTAKKYFLLAASGFLHDLESEKPGMAPLDRMICHPERRAMLLLQLPKVPEELITIMLQHHENEKGTGYPHGLKDHEIHPLAKVMGVAEEFYHCLSDGEFTVENVLRTLNEMAKNCLHSLNIKVIEALVLAFNQSVPFEIVQYQLSDE